MLVRVISPTYDAGANEDDVVRRYVEYYEGIRRQRGARTSVAARP